MRRAELDIFWRKNLTQEGLDFKATQKNKFKKEI